MKKLLQLKTKYKMKKLYTLILGSAFLLLTIKANGTVINIAVGVDNSGNQANTFFPSIINYVNVGDTIVFVLAYGTVQHNVTSTSVPAGASPMSSGTLTTAGQTYIYPVTVAGTYNYQCTFHIGMTGAFTASYPSSNCFAHDTTYYDSTLNTFTLYVDNATSAMATGYYWDFGDGTSSILATPTHTFAIDSLYNVCLKIYIASGDSCSYCHIIGIDSAGNIVRTSGFTLVVQNSTSGISEINNQQSTITLYPNPATNNLTIAFGKTTKKVVVTITDVTGKLVNSEQLIVNSKSATIDISGFAEGVYIVKIQTGDGVEMRKLIKN